MIDKVRTDAAAAVAAVTTGSSIAIGGFGRAGVPSDLIDAVCEAGVTELHVMSNNGGMVAGLGIGRLLTEHRVRRFSCSFPVNPEFFEQYFAGRVEIDLVPQGTLAERLRAGGAGVGAFYTPTAVGTLLGDGGFVVRQATADAPAVLQTPKERRIIDGRAYVLEYPLRPDFALVKASIGDRYGNLRFRLGARNFNPLAAMAARTTIAQVESIAPDGLDPDDAHLPGAFVDHVVVGAPARVLIDALPGAGSDAGPDAGRPGGPR